MSRPRLYQKRRRPGIRRRDGDALGQQAAEQFISGCRGVKTDVATKNAIARQPSYRLRRDIPGGSRCLLRVP